MRKNQRLLSPILRGTAGIAAAVTAVALGALAVVRAAPPAFSDAHAQARTTPQAGNTVKVGQAAPLFTLHNAIDNRIVALKSLRGRPVTLFFFCGCTECLNVAKAWAQLQRSGALASSMPSSEKTLMPPKKRGAASKLTTRSGKHSTSQAPITVLVYSGDPGGVKELAARAGLDTDSGKTILLADTDMGITDRQYHFETCPRSVVIDGNGIIRYTNDGKENEAQRAPAEVIVAPTLNAIQICQKLSLSA